MMKMGVVGRTDEEPCDSTSVISTTFSTPVNPAMNYSISPNATILDEDSATNRVLLENDEEGITECIETNLLLERSIAVHRFRRPKRWKRKHSLGHVVDVNYGQQQSPVHFNSNTLSPTNLSRITSTQSHCPKQSYQARQEPILRRVQSTGDLSQEAPPPAVTASECPGSPFLSAIMDDVSGWLTPPKEALPIVDFSSLHIPSFFSVEEKDDDDDAKKYIMSPSRSQQFDEATWDKVLMHHAPGGVLVVLAAVTMHPLLCTAALVAVCAGALTWQRGAIPKTSSSSEPSDAPADAVVEASETDSNSSVGPLMGANHSQISINDKETFLLRNDIWFQLGWIRMIYPMLDAELLSNVGGFVGIRDVAELFQVFFADDAPFSFQAFQEKRGDLNVRYGSWESANPEEESVSFLSRTTTTNLGPDSFHSLSTRTLTFEAKTNNNYVGPSFALTTKRQKFLMVNPNLAVLESESAVSNVPFGDRFRIIDRWIFQMTEDGLQIASYMSHVKLTGSCPFASQIRVQSSKTLTDVAKAWIAMAQKALQITIEQQHQVDEIEIVQSASGHVMVVNM